MVFRKRLFELKWIKLRNKWHYVENTTDYATCLQNSVNYLVALIARGVVYRSLQS